MPLPPDEEQPELEWSAEEAELDRLYREALDVVDAIERDVQLPFDPATAPDESEAGFTAQAVAEPANPETSVVRAPDHADGSQGVSPRATARQVLEAALFVGGELLSTKTLVRLLRNEFTPEFIDSALDSLNRQYAEEGRPYEIRMADGGWELALRPAFERVRHRVYGLGPKEVKLSQEALEVLAVVAYHQPISSDEIVALGKASPGGALRQLLRRELVAIERGEGGRKDVKYRTTERFLQLFDLRDLRDLPEAEEIAFK